MLLMTQLGQGAVYNLRASLGLLAEHSSPPRLPTGQVLRTHLITEDSNSWAPDPGCGHNQLIKPLRTLLLGPADRRKRGGEESWKQRDAPRRRVQTPGLLS